MKHFIRKLPVPVSFTFALLVSFPGCTSAAENEWIAISVEGNPQFQSGTDIWHPFTANDVLAEGSIIRTDSGDEAILVRGENTITILANTKIKLEKSDGILASIVQFFGEAFFEIEKRNTKHFEVKTPYMIAGVKGTSFGITVDKDTASTYLLDGRLEITDRKTGKHSDLLPGRYTMATRSGSFRSGLLMMKRHRDRWIKKAAIAAKKVVARKKLPRINHQRREKSQPAEHKVRNIDLGAPLVGADILPTKVAGQPRQNGGHKAGNGSKKKHNDHSAAVNRSKPTLRNDGISRPAVPAAAVTRPTVPATTVTRPAIPATKRINRPSALTKSVVGTNNNVPGRPALKDAIIVDRVNTTSRTATPTITNNSVP
ncbi:MAG: FecR domain-containing protein [Gammaproteobacteria bacterium]